MPDEAPAQPPAAAAAGAAVDPDYISSFIAGMTRAAAVLNASGLFAVRRAHEEWARSFIVRALGADEVSELALPAITGFRYRVTMDRLDGKLHASYQRVPARPIPAWLREICDLFGLSERRATTEELGPEDAPAFFNRVARLSVLSTVVQIGVRLVIGVGRLFLVGLLSLVRATLTAIPYMLATVVITFVTGDAWRLFAESYNWRYWGLMAFFLVLSLAFVLKSIIREDPLDKVVSSIAEMQPGPSAAGRLIRRVWTRPSTAEILRGLGCVPSAPLADTDTPVLKRRVGLLSIGQVVAVGGLVAAALVLVGMIRIDLAATTTLMGGKPATVLLTLPGKIVITRELVLVSTTLGALSSLTFAAVGLNDERPYQAFVDANAKSMKRIVTILRSYRDGCSRGLVMTGLELPPPDDVAGG